VTVTWTPPKARRVDFNEHQLKKGLNMSRALLIFVVALALSTALNVSAGILIPGGDFQMGDSFGEGRADELPVHTVYVNSFYMDAYEVTNQQYADALNWAWAQGDLIQVTSGVVYQYGGTSYPYCDTTVSSAYSQITWDGSTFSVVAGKAGHPMVQVSWYGSVAYCNWRSAMENRPLCYDLSNWTCNFSSGGHRLPTEAAWEKAAAWDPVQQYHFRFGEHTDGCGYDCLDGERVNYDASGDPYEAGADPWTTPVGWRADPDRHGEPVRDPVHRRVSANS
jgi:formylglycine-generating enzyme required for sulfatase activity